MKRRDSKLGVGLLVVLGVALLSGCQRQLAGKWTLREAVPNREVFAIDNAEFAADGRFAAEITNEGRTRREAGEYEFNGLGLTLRPDSGGRLKYNAKLRGDELTLTASPRRVVLERVRP